ncbi:MAG: M28 family peptidase [Bacteroidota bacterium]
MARFATILICIGLYFNTLSQTDQDAFFIKSIYDATLSSGKCYEWLGKLCNQAGPRLSGSSAAEDAVHLTYDLLSALNPDSIWLQACEVPHWERGKPEVVYIANNGIKIHLSALSLGNSGSSPNGLQSKVIEVKSLEGLESLSDEFVKGKIVFFNRPMDSKIIDSFNAYGGAVDQRVYGPDRAAKKGAIACLVRSMTTSLDDFPHTGTTVFDNIDPIPAIAISTKAADLLHQQLTENKEIEVYVENHCASLPPKQSHNIIAEIKGSEFPDEIILVGGHLDAWDVGQGAHDDGSGCVQAMQVLHTFNMLNYKPKRTLRIVLFMNEENGLAGGLTYAKVSNENKEFHLAAIESDAGGFTPRGFKCSAEKEVFPALLKSLNDRFSLLEAYDLYLKPGGGGADINPLKSQGGLLIGFRPDSQRYFDYHHTANDTFDKVNKRELELGAAAISSLVYLIDFYGL